MDKLTTKENLLLLGYGLFAFGALYAVYRLFV